jgi:hypothetical protein
MDMSGSFCWSFEGMAEDFEVYATPFYCGEKTVPLQIDYNGNVVKQLDFKIDCFADVYDTLVAVLGYAKRFIELYKIEVSEIVKQ